MLNFNHAIMGSRHIVSPFWAMGQSTPAYPVGGGGRGVVWESLLMQI